MLDAQPAGTECALCIHSRSDLILTRTQGSSILIVIAVALALGFSYESSLVMLVKQWNRDPNYSSGFFVAPIALFIMYSRRGQIESTKVRPNWWGFLLLATILMLRFPLYEWNEQYIEAATLPLIVAVLVFALGGAHLLRVSLPAVVFLGFMLPLPPSLNALLSRPLQTVATVGSVSLLQALGVPVIAQGNVIITGETPLEVARACNGLSMLLSFITLIAAIVILVPRPWPERILLILSAIPIAVLTNIIRIAITAVAYRWLGAEVAEAYAHDYAGYAMMPVALAMVWLELKVCEWLFVEVEIVEPGALIRRRAGIS